MIEPDKKASRSVSVVVPSTAKKLDKRASSSGTAHGSAKWSAPPVRASSRKISRAQSSAPVKINDDCKRERSAVSTCRLLNCCHKAAEAKVATSVTVSMADSSAAPVWRAKRVARNPVMACHPQRWAAPSPG